MHKRKGAISIRNLLLVSNLASMLVFLTVVILYSNQSYRGLLLQEFMDKQRQTTTYVGNTIGQAAESVETLARATANNAVVVNNINQYRSNRSTMSQYEKMVFLRNMDRNLSTVAFSQDKIVSVNVLLEGLDTGTTAVNSAFDYSYYYPDETLRAQVRDSASCWLPTRRNDLPMSTFQQNILTFSCRIYSDMFLGEAVGSLVVNLDERLLYDKMAEYEGLGVSTLLLVDEEGVVLSGSDRRALGQTLSAAGYSYLDPVLRGEVGNGAVLDGRVVSYTCTNGSRWQLIAISDYREVVRPIDAMSRRVLTMGVVIILLFNLVSIITAFVISSPIIRLSQYAAGLQTSQDLASQVTGGSVILEINHLYDRFNGMMAQVDSLIGRLYRNEEQKRRKEFEVLQAQINPHFLYNTLESINWMALAKGQEDISRVVIKLGVFLRLSLNKGKSVYRVRDEISHLESYVEIQKIRSSGGIDYRCRVEEEILDRSMVKLLLQPLVENAILHGFNHREGCGRITVTGESRGEDILFTVEDDGCGMSEELIGAVLDLENEIGHGIKNVENRVKLFYGEEYGMQITSELDTGTRITLRIPGEIDEARCQTDG